MPSPGVWGGWRTDETGNYKIVGQGAGQGCRGKDWSEGLEMEDSGKSSEMRGHVEETLKLNKVLQAERMA